MNDLRAKLDVVNAALDLGDPFIPPRGVICSVTGRIYAAEWTGCMTLDMRIERSSVWKEAFRLEGLVMEHNGDAWVPFGCRARYFDRSSIRRILFIPEGCQPFSTWKREKSEE